MLKLWKRSLKVTYNGLVRGTLAGGTEAVFSGRSVNLPSGEGRTADTSKSGNWFGCVCALSKGRTMRDSVQSQNFST